MLRSCALGSVRILMIFSALLLVAAVVAAAELPVTRVVLYKNGLALFERSGDAKPGEPLRLDFKKSEMNDVLKTLVLDSTAGTITNLRYQLDEELDRRLAEIGLTIEEKAPLVTILDGLRGARIALTTTAGTVQGSIVSGRLSQHAQQAQKQELTVLTGAGELRIIDLDSVSGIKLTDERLQKRFTDALAAYEQAQSQERKSMWIETAGKPGALLARYLVPAPVWKSSYRLAFDAKGEATLEGWAIVENTSGGDWDKVQLTVVSGRPISFVNALYEPKYIERQQLELAEQESVRPMEMAGRRVDAAKAMAPPPPQMVPSAGLAMNGQMGASVKSDMFMRIEPTPLRAGGGVGGGVFRQNSPAYSRIAVDAASQEIGELFEYRFSQPASVKAGQSLLVPFVQQKITARQVYLWDASQGARPQRAVDLKNSTGKTLDGGPVTVYTTDGYAGETLMNTFKAGDKRFMSFAVDMGAKVDSRYGSSAEVVQSVTASQGIVMTRTTMEQTTTYTVTNVDAKEKTLLISHPAQAGVELLSPKPEEKTGDHYLFTVTVPSAGEAKLAVVERRPMGSSFRISDWGADQIFAYMSGRKLSPEARKKLETIAAKKREVSAAADAVRVIEGKINAAETDEERLRKNLGSLSGVAGQQDQVQRYAGDLAKRETEIRDLQTSLEAARGKQAALDIELAALVEKLNF